MEISMFIYIVFSPENKSQMYFACCILFFIPLLQLYDIVFSKWYTKNYYIFLIYLYIVFFKSFLSRVK